LADRRPSKLVVLPFDNETSDLTGPELVRGMVAGRVGGAGYESPGLAAVDSTLKEMGITDGGQLGAVSTEALGRAFDTDGLLFGSLEEFTYQNIGVLRRRLVRLRQVPGREPLRTARCPGGPSPDSHSRDRHARTHVAVPG